jgi:hypothetical protein
MRFDFGQQRDRMVERQLARRGIRDPAVMRAMRNVPRDRFVPADLVEFAYDDTPLPIDADQTISQPYIVALMADTRRYANRRARFSRISSSTTSTCAAATARRAGPRKRRSTRSP